LIETKGYKISIKIINDVNYSIITFNKKK
jgi:hypothetical protein